MTKNERKYAHIISSNLFFDRALDGLGVSRKYLGYYYILDIMNMLINDKKAIRSFSREVYPLLAEKYDKQAMSVERDIRHFIDKNWTKEMRDGLYPFWSSEEKPTCCRYIYMLKSYILTKII